ncbi:hypothetical protein VMT65_18320 [Nocardia sp. CDC153]|uniref:DUF7373 family lipoprotein n=1 Tax=Nocardia sp. CDC153 TaxID=3112167 RepID=UPI002DB8724F|nr:hypothetical protein [Nocardia sp. CDC153]MEC3955003.1 hypothetical protein [Nocardia sp. CDC153]
MVFCAGWSTRARLHAAVVVGLSIMVSAGCGTDSRSERVDLGKLDTGSYATTPQDPKAADATVRARVIEALRLGNVMPVGSEVDPALTHNTDVAHVFVGKNSFSGYLNVEHFDSDTPGFVTGFATEAQAPAEAGRYSLDNAVMIFDSDAAAAKAAEALARTGFDLKDDERADLVSLQSDRHPAAHIIWHPKKQNLASWYPMGRFVLVTVINQAEEFYLQSYWNAAPAPAPMALADKAIDVTADRLKSFQPTPPDKITGLPLDPDGILRLTLPRPEGDRTANAFPGALDKHGALHKADEPEVARALFERTGVDLVGYGAGELVRTRDSAAARTYFDTAFIDKFQHRIDSPPGLPNARCVKYHGPRQSAFPFTCYVTFGRYVASVWSQQQQDVYQRISAQYAILANDK